MTRELVEKSLSAAKWGTSSTLLRFLLQIGSQAILTRILGPQVYGVFGAGLIVMALVSLLTDIGFSWNLLRKVELSEADIQFALTGQIVFGTLLAILLYVGADSIAFHLAGEPIGWVIRLLAFSVIFNAAASTPSILLSRALNFRKLGETQLLSYLAGYFMVGIPMALAGCDAMSLVAAWLVQSMVRCWLAFDRCGLVWIPTFKHKTYRAFLSDGLLVFFTNVVNWLAYNLDRVTVSKFLPSEFLGIYNVSSNLAGTPNAILLGSLQPLFMAAGAKMSGLAQIRAAYAGVLRAALISTLPFYFSLALGADDLVHALYGEKWNAAGEVMAILFLGMPFFVIWSLSTPVLWNTGKPHYESAFQLPIIVMAALLYLAASDRGLAALAIAADIVLFLRALTMFIAASRQVALDWRELLPALWLGLAFSAAALASHWLFLALPISGWMRLAGSGGLTVLVCLMLLKCLPSGMSCHAIELVGHISVRAAGWLRKNSYAKS